jgi:hypothetical protein
MKKSLGLTHTLAYSLVFGAMVAFATSAPASPPPPPLFVSVHVGRTSLDVLDSLDIAVVVHNPASALQTVKFPKPAEYEIDVVDSGGRVVWTSLPPSPPPGVTFTAHQRTFGPGPTTLVVNDWNELARDGSSPLAGSYAVHVRLLAQMHQPAASTSVTFAMPLSPDALPKLKAGQDVTIAGELDASRVMLTGIHGASATLTRRLLPAPPGIPIVVRGFAVDGTNGARTFTFERWARYGPSPAIPAATLLPSIAPSPVASKRPGERIVYGPRA